MVLSRDGSACPGCEWAEALRLALVCCDGELVGGEWVMHGKGVGMSQWVPEPGLF